MPWGLSDHVINDLSDGFVPSGNKPLPAPMLTKYCDCITKGQWVNLLMYWCITLDKFLSTFYAIIFFLLWNALLNKIACKSNLIDENYKK